MNEDYEPTIAEEVQDQAGQLGECEVYEFFSGFAITKERHVILPSDASIIYERRDTTGRVVKGEYEYIDFSRLVYDSKAPKEERIRTKLGGAAGEQLVFDTLDGMEAAIDTRFGPDYVVERRGLGGYVIELSRRTGRGKQWKVNGCIVAGREMVEKALT